MHFVWPLPPILDNLAALTSPLVTHLAAGAATQFSAFPTGSNDPVGSWAL